MFEMPLEFLEEMKKILGEDYCLYENCMEGEAFRGVSLNRLKVKNINILPFEVQKCPFYKDGYYISCDEKGIGNTPLHHAGAFYVQEPSAMSAVSLLDVREGDKVLDLCAAPGGKSAQIASCLNGTGLIWSNEVVKNRAQILLSNFERMGISKGVVSSCYPEVLCRKLEGYFDKVLVDAPCSGEGMFRKNPEAVKEWSREHVSACANRQLSVLDSAAKCLKTGGILVYSTCTFSYEENEGVIQKFLQEHSDFEMCGIEEHFGRKTELPCAVRITPLENGEGHFAAKLIRTGNHEYTGKFYQTSDRRRQKEMDALSEKMLSDIFVDIPSGRLEIIRDKLYILPDELPDISGTGVIRAGVLAGVWKKNRIEPEHALFTSYPVSCFQKVFNLHTGDHRIYEFLRGEEIDCDTSGYTAVAFCGMTVGFGKCSNGRLKNKYPKGLRQRCGGNEQC